MLSWRERRDVAEKEAVIKSLQAKTPPSPWWKKFTAVANSPFVMAVVVTTMLGVGSDTFKQSEACRSNLNKANFYFRDLQSEVIYELNKKLAGVKQVAESSNDRLKAIEVFQLPVPALHAAFNGRPFLDLLNSQIAVEERFGLLRPVSFPLLFINLYSLRIVSEPDAVKGQFQQRLGNALIGRDALSFETFLKNISDKLINDSINPLNAMSMFLGGSTRLDYDCRPWSLLKANFYSRSSPFSDGLFPIN